MTQLQTDIIDYIIIEGWATAENIAEWFRLEPEQVEAELEELRLDGQVRVDGYEDTPEYHMTSGIIGYHSEPLFKYIGGPVSCFFAATEVRA
jgi:hypothetical protein